MAWFTMGIINKIKIWLITFLTCVVSAIKTSMKENVPTSTAPPIDTLTIAELMEKKKAMEKELELITRILREKILKT